MRVKPILNLLESKRVGELTRAAVGDRGQSHSALKLHWEGISSCSSPPPIVSEPDRSLGTSSSDTSLQAERLWSLLNEGEHSRVALITLRRLRKRQRETSAQEGFVVVVQYLSVAVRLRLAGRYRVE